MFSAPTARQFAGGESERSPMILSRTPIVPALFCAVLSFTAGAGNVLAEDAPVDIHAPAPKRAKPPKDAKEAPKPSMTAAEAIAKANAYFNEARVMSADFLQIGPDGTRSEGELYVSRPGKMLFNSLRRKSSKSSPTAARSPCATRSWERRTSISSRRRH